MKITKHELDEFWKTLGEGFYQDDVEQEPAEDDGLPPDAIINIEYGIIGWQGDGPAREVPGIISASRAASMTKGGRDGFLDFLSALKAWKKSLTTDTIVVQIGKEHTEDLKAWLKERKRGKIIR
jgi:hypothetical protein